MSAARLTVVETVAYQVAGQSPSSEESRYTVGLRTDDEHYTRRVKGGKDWHPVDCGWVKRASMVVIVNHDRKKLLQLSGGLIVRPGSDCRFQPTNLRKLMAKGAVTYTVRVFPG